MVHRVVRDLAALFELTRHTRTVLLDAVAALKERRLRAALLESIEQIVGQAVRIVFALAGRAVVERQRNINICLRDVAVHRVAQTAAQRVEIGFLAVQTVERERRECERTVAEIGIVSADDLRKRRSGDVKPVLFLVEPDCEVIALDALAVDLELSVRRDRGFGIIIFYRPGLFTVELRRAAERGHRRLQRNVFRAVLLHDALAQLFAVRGHGLGLAGNERLVRVGAHQDAVSRDLLLGRAENLRYVIRDLLDRVLGQLVVLLRDDEQIALLLGGFGGLPRERRTEILRRDENDAVLHGRRGRHVPALLAHLNLGARGLDLSGLLVPDCRAALRAFVPGQIDLKLIAQRLERREQVAALIAVRRRLKVERLSVAVAQLVVHLIDDLVRSGPAEHGADRCRHQLDREHDERDQKHDHQCQHAVVALAFSTAAARTCIAVRRTICHFELFPSCLLHPGNAFCILRGGRLL